jgi:hypothetical protein
MPLRRTLAKLHVSFKGLFSISNKSNNYEDGTYEKLTGRSRRGNELPHIGHGVTGVDRGIEAPG